ncbi:MAG: hypothetical protein C0401_11240 [Anaerolinea sp.]|nr:hypothetical protein [Anaerolinea sp.]
MTIKGERILITGATGFIGGCLAEQLASENQVSALVRDTAESKTNRLLSLGVELIPGDLHDLDSLRNAIYSTDIVYHLAEERGFSRKACCVNIEATKTLIDASQSGEVKRFVYVSTVAVNNNLLKREDHTHYEPYPWYLHTVAKCAGEKYGFEKYRHDGFPFSVVRPSAVYARNSHLVDDIVAWPKNHRHIGYPVLGDGSNLMHFGHVDDIVQGLVLAGSNQQAIGNAYTIVDDMPISWNAMLDLIKKVFGIQLKVWHIPVRPVRIAASVIEWLSRATTAPVPARLLVDVFSGDFIFSNRKAKVELGFNPDYSSPFAGLGKDKN